MTIRHRADAKAQPALCFVLGKSAGAARGKDEVRKHGREKTDRIQEHREEF